MSASAREQITAYLLGELDPVSAAEFEARLAADPELAAEVDSLREVVAELGAAPAEAWHAQRTLPALKLPGDAAEPVRDRARWGARRLVLAAAGAAAVFAIGLAVGIGVGGDGGSGSGEPLISSVGLHSLGGGEGSGLVSLADGKPRTAEVVIDGLPPSGRGEHYELWLLGKGEPLSLGSFTVGPDGHADEVLTIPVDPGSYSSFDVSVEPDDGDPSHSGDSVLRGPSAAS